MCHAFPCPIEEFHPETNEATVNLGGIRKRVRIDLLEDPKIGDYVVVHTGFALIQLDEDAAEATLRLMANPEVRLSV